MNAKFNLRTDSLSFLFITATFFFSLCATQVAMGEDLKLGGFLDDIDVDHTAPVETKPSTSSQIRTPAPTSKLDPNSLNGQFKGLWRRNWYEIAKRMSVHDGYYFICATYDSRFPSSRHKTVRQFIEDHKKYKEEDIGAGLKKKIVIKPNQVDAKAYVEAIPYIATGEYGYIFDGQITQILSEDRFVLDDLQVIDRVKVQDEIATVEAKLKGAEEKMNSQIRSLQRKKREQDRRESRYSNSSSSSSSSRSRDNSLDRSIDRAQSTKERYMNQIERDLNRDYYFRRKLLDKKDLKGPIIVMATPTLNLRKGQRWPVKSQKGISLAVCGIYKSVRSDGSKGPSAPLAIPTTILGKGLDEQSFIKMLHDIDMTPQMFIDRLGELNRQYRSIDDALKLVGRVIRTKLDKHRHEKLLSMKKTQIE